MRDNVLVLGASRAFRRALEFSLSRAHVRAAETAEDTEGLGIDIVVIAGKGALAELADVRVHPALHDRPVVLAVPGADLAGTDWRAMGVWPVTTSGIHVLQDVADVVDLLLSRLHHPVLKPRPRLVDRSTPRAS